MNPLGESLFVPRSVALIGASSDAGRLTARAQRYLARHGFAGAVYPVNPRGGEVLGLPAFARLADVPEPVDLAYVLVGTEQAEAAVEACGAARVPVACVLADGFADAGAAGMARQARLVAAARAGGVRLLGPNSMGAVSCATGMACSVNATLEMERLPVGGLALISQSGSVMGALLSRAAARGIGFSRLVSTGNEADLTAGELLDVLVDDPLTNCVLLFLETIRAPEVLAAAARRAAAGKPVVAYKLGRSAAGAALATTHTGALAGSDAAADAFLRAQGIIRVDMLEALLETPALLLGGRAARGTPRAARVVTTTGGGGAMIVDRLGVSGIAAAMQDVTLAGTRKDVVASALTAARSDPESAIAIAVIGSSAQFHPQTAIAGVLASAGPAPICAFLAPDAPDSLRLLAEAGIAGFRTPEGCAEAVRAWLDWPEPAAMVDAGDVSAAARAAAVPGVADEPGARAVFAALGIADGARLVDPKAANELVWPVALKAVVPGLAHKTEAGAVALNVADAAALATIAAEMRARLGAEIAFLAQPMARGVGEVIVGFRRDPVVGPIVVLGAGGVLAELSDAVAVEVAPVDLTRARAMIGRVRALRALDGYRGRAAGDREALAAAVVAVSRLAAVDAVIEAEINPLIVMQRGVMMADALVVTTPATVPAR